MIEDLHGSALTNITDEQAEENTFKLEKIVKQTTKLNNECKNKIKGNKYKHNYLIMNLYHKSY
jgi:syntaxin 1B/2/3